MTIYPTGSDISHGPAYDYLEDFREEDATRMEKWRRTQARVRCLWLAVVLLLLCGLAVVALAFAI